MPGIHVYNKLKEDYSNTGKSYPIYRGTVLGNPYTHIKNKNTKALFIVENKEDALKMYSKYFDIMYGSNVRFTKAIDILYEKYKNGEDIYLECYCSPKPCHGEIIKQKLMQRLIKEKIISNEKNIQQKQMA